MSLKDSRTHHVVFVDEKIRRAYEELGKQRSKGKELRKLLDKAFDDLKADPFIGIKIQKNLWPEEYARKYSIDNLRKLNLQDGWRLIYFVRGTEVDIVAIVLEWFNHKQYARRFGYKAR